MNNSKIAIDNVSLTLEDKDNSELLREEEARLVRVISAIERLSKSEEWSSLKIEIFDSRIASLEKQMKNECEKPELDHSEIYRLQGRLFEARKYDLDELNKDYRLKLSNIKKLTQPTER